MKKILASFTLRQRIAIVAVALAAGAALYAFVGWRQEADFRPLFTGLAPEDAAAIVQKLKEGGVEYRLGESGAVVLVPSARAAELRIGMAAAGLPKSGRIGFELFDKANLGATEFSEHVNYKRALEGELERSVMALAEVEQARVHLSFSKESVFLDDQQPAKASVLVRLRPGARLSPQNVLAIDHLVASAVDGLSPDAVSVVDMNGNLLGRPRAPESPDGPGPSEASMDYRRRLESDLLAKINSTLGPLLGAEKYRAGVSVECDMTGGEQSEEIFDPARSVMANSQRSEDSSGPLAASGAPGTASTLPRPTSRPGSFSNRISRVTENITYQATRTIKKTRLPAGAMRKMSLAVLVDQTVSWVKEGAAYKRALVPPDPQRLKVIHDLVAGITGFNAERGDQLIVETLPFETTLLTEPPDSRPAGPAKTAPPPLPFGLTRPAFGIGGGVALLLIVALGASLLRRRRGGAGVRVSSPAALTAGEGGDTEAEAAPVSSLEAAFDAKVAERDALQNRLDAQALNALKLAPPITKTAEVLARHLREKIKQDAVVPAQILHSWIHGDDEG
jgi:flagellar M-ring protein FliF